MSKYKHPNQKAQLEPTSELLPVPVITQITNVPEPQTIKRVDFVADAMVNFTLIKHIDSVSYDIELANDLILFQDKQTKTSYMVPLSNVRTVRFN